MATLRLLLLTAVLALAPLGEKRQEFYPDGTLKAEYIVNANEQKHGRYREYWPDGADKITTLYKVDRIDGKFESWHQDGSPDVMARYRKGELDGDWTQGWPGGIARAAVSYEQGKREGLYQEWNVGGDLRLEEHYEEDVLHGDRRLLLGGSVLSEQIWADGRLVGLWGSKNLYPIPREQLWKDLEGLSEQAEEAKPKGERRPGARMDPDYATALALADLRAYRMVAGVPWRDVIAEALACERAQAAASLTAQAGGIRNQPSNPGMAEEDYEVALAALSHCLLAQGWVWPKALQAWIHPPIEGGLNARRLMLQPRYRQAGFGMEDDFAAFWTLDSSGPPWAGSAIFLPANGWMPIELFDGKSAWSVELSPRHWSSPDPDELTVQVWELDEDFIRSPRPLKLSPPQTDRFLLWFRPERFQPVADYRYWVEIDGLRDAEGEVARLAYLVHFTTREAPLTTESEH